jgi:4-amino-4-deoxychorismate lyase
LDNSNIKYFETIKCDDYTVFNLEYHVKRVAKTIGININLSDYIYPPSSKLLKCKVIYTQEKIVDVQYQEYKKRDIKSFKIIHNDNIKYSKKELERSALDNLFAKKEKCDEIIIVKNGIVTDTSIANIAVFYEDIWYTSKMYILEGTTRSRYIDNNLLIQKNISLEMLENCEKIALMNAMIDFDIIENYSLSL